MKGTRNIEIPIEQHEIIKELANEANITQAKTLNILIKLGVETYKHLKAKHEKKANQPEPDDLESGE